MRYLFLVAVFFSLTSQAQWKSFELTDRGDTLNRVDMKGLKQGPWIVKVPALRGERGYEEEGYFTNDLKEGLWKRFSLEGDLIALENYNYGMKNGKCQYFTNAGDPLREESWRAIDPQNPYDTIDIRDVNDPSKIVRKEIIKVEPKSYKHGTWTYYSTLDGSIEETEHWVMNRPKEEVDAEANAAADDLAPIDPASGKKTAAKADPKKQKPKDVLEFEKKNAGKKKVKVRDGSTGG
jgi:antitoxin component YwqK of YwqJK toxin-antitoxin module